MEKLKLERLEDRECPALTAIPPGGEMRVSLPEPILPGYGELRAFDYVTQYAVRDLGYVNPRLLTPDVNRDGWFDLVILPGTGDGNVMAVFDGKAGGVPPGPGPNFDVPAPELRYHGPVEGFNLTDRIGMSGTWLHDNNGLTRDVVYVGADVGGGPVACGIEFDDSWRPDMHAFFALPDQDYRLGLDLDSDDIDGDGVGDLLVRGGPGSGPLIYVYGRDGEDRGKLLLTTDLGDRSGGYDVIPAGIVTTLVTDGSRGRFGAVSYFGKDIRLVNLDTGETIPDPFAGEMEAALAPQ